MRLKIKKTFFVLGGFVLCLGAAGSYEELVDERTSLVGRICTTGENCGRPLRATPVSDEPRTAEDIYKQGCAACHDAGIGGAPRLSDAAMWKQRLQEKGRDRLLQNALNGVGAMPPRGVCVNCSDDEVDRAVEYILSVSGL